MKNQTGGGMYQYPAGCAESGKYRDEFFSLEISEWVRIAKWNTGRKIQSRKRSC